MHRKTCLFVLLLSLCNSLIWAQKPKYRSFENIDLGTGASVISCFVQDGQGLIWIGSNKGLYSFDGYTVQPHFRFGSVSNTQIYCGVIAGSSRFYLGSDNGLLLYNLETDRYEELPLAFPTDIRSMALQGDTLWLGALNGLYAFNLKTNRLKHFDPAHYASLPHKTVYAIIRSSADQVYIGTYDGLCRYQPAGDRFEKIDLPANPRKNNQFINSLLEDRERRCIWIGMEGGLLRYDLNTLTICRIDQIQDNSVKSLAIDGSGNVLAGTDNGLYVYAEGEAVQHVMHDSRNPNSLYNNIVWNVFADRDRNIWLGTDSGVSLSRNNRALQFVPLSDMTGTGDGNQFYSLFRDSRDYFWLGGSNGIIRVNQSNGDWTNAIWFNTDDPLNPLPHGRIRHIYEDRDSDLWISTDGSVNRFDYRSRQFVQYNILDSTGTFNTNWAYNLFEDGQGKLWIATCLGGIFVVDKTKLIANGPKNFVAEYNFNTGNGLSGMFVNQIVPDKLGHVWVLLYNNGVDRIDAATRRVSKFPLGSAIGGKNPSYMLCDRQGLIWLGFAEGVLRIDPADNRTDTILFDTSKTNEVLSMAEVEDNIWISTTDGFWLVDTRNLQPRFLNLSERRFLSLFYDERDSRILLGDVDGFAVTTPAMSEPANTDRPIIATALYVNSELKDAGEKSIRYTGSIRLNYRQNNIALDLSDLPYALAEKSKLVYRLDEVDADWNTLSSKSNRISYSNLSHGQYRLLVSKLDASGRPSEHPYELQIVINAPWYFTFAAKTVYALLLLSLAGWTFNFYRVKNRLKIERIEKEKIMEQSRAKLEFLTNLSHELKTPLSMIIGPISRMLPELKNPAERQQLKQVQHNAIKLNALIHQLLDFNRIGESSNSLLILSRIELVSFARKLFDVFREAEDESRFQFQFESNCDQIYLDLDVIKWESILSNLLSNAVKYSPAGGRIGLTIGYNDQTGELKLHVSDSGIGIPAKDIPYIFQRFFQSSKTAGNKEGTGIGLYLVKTYTELHGGKVSISSEENAGTTVTLSLPVGAQNNEPADGSNTRAWLQARQAETNRQLILVVDDNAEVAAFVRNILLPNYRCELASDGESGFAKCLALKPDLVISDVMMPGTDGLEMVQRIRSHVPTSTIPVILLTAKDDRETELASIQLNVDAFIGKPFEPDILLSRIEQLISQKQKLEAKIRLETLAGPKEIEAESQDEKFLARITHIIEEHLSDSELNVTSLGDISGVNNKQIYRKLKQLTGMTPVEYIKSVRMKKAAMLLRQQKFSVAEVMYMVGFSNHSYFSKCFRAEFNKTPLQYKEELGAPMA